MNRDEAAGDRMQTICTYAIDPACKRTSSGQSPSNLTPRSINCTYDACRVHAFRVRPSSRIRRRYSCDWARLITRRARRLVACHSASKFCMPNDTLSPRCASTGIFEPTAGLSAWARRRSPAAGSFARTPAEGHPTIPATAQDSSPLPAIAYARLSWPRVHASFLHPNSTTGPRASQHTRMLREGIGNQKLSKVVRQIIAT